VLKIIYIYIYIYIVNVIIQWKKHIFYYDKNQVERIKEKFKNILGYVKRENIIIERKYK